MSDDLGLLLAEIIKQCPVLDKLVLPEHPYGHKLAVAGGAAPFAAQLSSLRVLLILTEARDVTYLADLILPFRNLTSLVFRAVLFGPADRECTLSAISTPYRLPINDLYLDIADGADADFVSTATQAILAIIDVASVERLVLSNWTGDTTVFDWLAGSPALRKLDVDTVTVDGLQVLLEDLLVAIHPFPNLEMLRIYPEPFFVEVDPKLAAKAPAMMPLSFFLDGLPTSIRWTSLLGLYFEGSDDLPETQPIKGMPSGGDEDAAIFLGFLLDWDDEDDEPVMGQMTCVKKVDATGKLTWHLCVAVRPLHSACAQITSSDSWLVVQDDDEADSAAETGDGANRGEEGGLESVA